MPNINIEFNRETATLHWKTDGVDGREALWIMSDAINDMYRYFFQEPLRPVFQPQNARVCIEMAEDKLAIAFRPEDDLAAAKALVAAALVVLSEKSPGEFLNPFEIMFGAIIRDSIAVDEGLARVEC